jgi:uncharacterized protein YxeA
MKKILSAVMVVLATSVFAAEPEVNKKTIAAFEFTFKEAKEVAWYAEENYDQVYFKLNNIKTQIKYDKEGNLLSCFRMYTEENLPLLIRLELKKVHGGKAVKSVAELTTDNITEYHMTLEDEKHWYTVKADVYGGLSTLNKLRKA